MQVHQNLQQLSLTPKATFHTWARHRGPRPNANENRMFVKSRVISIYEHSSVLHEEFPAFLTCDLFKRSNNDMKSLLTVFTWLVTIFKSLLDFQKHKDNVRKFRTRFLIPGHISILVAFKRPVNIRLHKYISLNGFLFVYCSNIKCIYNYQK